MEKAQFREQRLLLGGKLYPFDKFTQQEINQFRAQQRHKWAIQATQNIKGKLDIHISSVPPVTSLTTFFPSNFKPTSENGREIIPDYLPLWLREWYQLRENNVETKDLIKLNAPNEFPVHPFWNTLRHKQIVTEKTKAVKRAGWVKVEESELYKYPRWSWCLVFPKKRQPVIDPETGWVKIKEKYASKHEQWSKSWRADQQEFEEANPTKIFQGPGTPPGKGYVVVVCGVSVDPKTKKIRFHKYYLPKEDMPKVKRKQIDHAIVKELFKIEDCVKLVQRTALNYILSDRSPWEGPLSCFVTRGRRSKNSAFKQYLKDRAEDLESILWEEILLGTPINTRDLRFALKRYFDRAINTKKKYEDVDIEEDMKPERTDFERLRRKWEMSKASPVHDEENRFSQA